uniref:Uncharacterized protein n=1 Tax=Gasterosteus aculeatus TaxID=69293 RepID=G3PSZ3_GASAC
SRRPGPLRGSDPLQQQCSSEPERLRRPQRVRLLVADAGETLHPHRGNLERGVRGQRLHRRTHISGGCWKPVARQRRNRRADRRVEPRPRGCGPLRGDAPLQRRQGVPPRHAGQRDATPPADLPDPGTPLQDRGVHLQWAEPEGPVHRGTDSSQCGGEPAPGALRRPEGPRRRAAGLLDPWRRGPGHVHCVLVHCGRCCHRDSSCPQTRVLPGVPGPDAGPRLHRHRPIAERQAEQQQSGERQNGSGRRHGPAGRQRPHRPQPDGQLGEARGRVRRLRPAAIGRGRRPPGR